ncbi:MAG: hypothetical protein J0I45_19140 [Bosea sp.]|nr:hypothetical protein [Bosea sp. (in: a-proteobacteria)]
MDHSAADKSMSRADWLKKELRLGLILFLYLFTLLFLFVLNEDIAKREMGESLFFSGFAVFNALILTKVMMVAEHIDLARRISTRRRIWVIVIEAIFCTVLFLTVHALERIVVGLVHGQPLSHSMPSFGGGGLCGLFIVSLIFFVSLLPFFTFKQVARAVGADRIQDILFGHPGSH